MGNKLKSAKRSDFKQNNMRCSSSGIPNPHFPTKPLISFPPARTILLDTINKIKYSYRERSLYFTRRVGSCRGSASDEINSGYHSIKRVSQLIKFNCIVLLTPCPVPVALHHHQHNKTEIHQFHFHFQLSLSQPREREI